MLLVFALTPTLLSVFTFTKPSTDKGSRFDSLFIRTHLTNVLSLMQNIDLTRPCDACGRTPVGGGARCLKCNIYFCFTCMVEQIYLQNKLPLECPMCGGKLS
jgi:DNA-directed RNA polymerase subunit RPC12/RpoP